MCCLDWRIYEVVDGVAIGILLDVIEFLLFYVAAGIQFFLWHIRTRDF